MDVPQVKTTTRARPVDTESTSSKRRKIEIENATTNTIEPKISASSSHEQDSRSSVPVAEDQCFSSSPNLTDEGSSFPGNGFKRTDLEDEDEPRIFTSCYGCVARGTMLSCNGSTENSCEKSKPTKTRGQKGEIDEYFAEQERKIQENMKTKYNFDFVSEKPLKGPYEWVKVEP